MDVHCASMQNAYNTQQQFPHPKCVRCAAKHLWVGDSVMMSKSNVFHVQNGKLLIYAIAAESWDWSFIKVVIYKRQSILNEVIQLSYGKVEANLDLFNRRTLKTDAFSNWTGAVNRFMNNTKLIIEQNQFLFSRRFGRLAIQCENIMTEYKLH